MDVTLIAEFVVNEVPVNAIAPEVLVKFNAPVLSVNPDEAVSKPEDVKPPAMICVDPKVLIMKFAAPPASGMV